MKYEPDIVKELRDAEKLGGLQNKIQETYEDLETIKEPSEDAPDQTTGFFEEDVELNVKIDDSTCENTEKVLQDTIDLYRFIFDNVNDEIIYLSKHGKILEVNNRSVDIFGRKPEEIIGKNFVKTGIFGVKEIPKMLKLFKEVKSGKEIGLIELVVKHKAGYKIPVEASIRLVEKNGKIEGIVGIIRDITKRKKSEEKIQRASKEWQTTFDSISDMISVLDKNNIILNANKAYIDTFNMNRDEIIGKQCHDIVHGSDKPFPGCPHLQTLKTKKSVTVEFFEPHLEIFLEVSTSPVFDENGEVVGSTHIAKNITKRKNIELELQERLKEFKCLYSITDSIRSEKSLNELLVNSTNFIKDALQYPDISRCRIKLDGKIYENIKFEETNFKQTTDIIVDGKKRGVIEVFFLEKIPEADEGPFLKEERKLLDVIASNLGVYVEKIEKEEKIIGKINQLEQYKKLTVDRELKMADMKKRIEELKGK